MSTHLFRHVLFTMVFCSSGLFAPSAHAQDPYHPSEDALKSMVNGDAVTEGASKSGPISGRPSAPRSNMDSTFQNDPLTPESQSEHALPKQNGIADTAPAAPKPMLIPVHEAALSDLAMPQTGLIVPPTAPSRALETRSHAQRVQSSLLKRAVVLLAGLGLVGIALGYRHLSRK